MELDGIDGCRGKAYVSSSSLYLGPRLANAGEVIICSRMRYSLSQI